jgi:hypothetical protein
MKRSKRETNHDISKKYAGVHGGSVAVPQCWLEVLDVSHGIGRVHSAACTEVVSVLLDV